MEGRSSRGRLCKVGWWWEVSREVQKQICSELQPLLPFTQRGLGISLCKYYLMVILQAIWPRFLHYLFNSLLDILFWIISSVMAFFLQCIRELNLIQLPGEPKLRKMVHGTVYLQWMICIWFSFIKLQLFSAGWGLDALLVGYAPGCLTAIHVTEWNHFKNEIIMACDCIINKFLHLFM